MPKISTATRALALCAFVGLVFAAPTTAQEKPGPDERLTLHIDGEPLLTVLKGLNASHGLNFTVSEEANKRAGAVHCRLEQVTLAEAVEMLCACCGLEAEVRGRFAIIRARELVSAAATKPAARDAPPRSERPRSERPHPERPRPEHPRAPSRSPATAGPTAPRTEPKKATRDKGPRAERTLKFAATATNTVVQPFEARRAGLVQARLDFAGGGELLVLVYASGQTRELARRVGPSPLNLEVELGKAMLELTQSYEVWIVHKSGPTALGELKVSAPSDATKPKPERPKQPARPSKAKSYSFVIDAGHSFVQELEAPRAGRLELEVAFSGKGAVFAVISDAKGRKKLLEKQSEKSFNLYYQVRPNQGSLRLLLTSFGAERLRGTVRVKLP